MAFLGDFTNPGIKLSFNPAPGSPCRVIPGAPTDNDGKVITVVSSMHGQRVGKEFSLVDGAVKKGTEANYSEYSAQSVYVADLADLQRLFATLKPSQCIILGCIPGAGLNPYRLNSQGWFEQRLKLPKGAGKLIGAVDAGDGLLRYGRFKENFTACRFTYVDRDFNEAMPAELGADEAGFFAQMDTVWPGFANAGKLIIGSSSNRVLRDGKPVNSSPSQHIYVELSGDDWNNWDQLRTRLDARAINAGLGFNTLSKAGANLKRSVFDISVLTVSRLVFEGAPLVHAPLTLAPADSRLVAGTAIPFPDALECSERTEYTRKSGNVINDAGRKLSVSNDAVLTWDTQLETEIGIMSLAEYHASGRGKLRCQTPFRDSKSWNGILNRTNDGRPFVHDNGAGVTYWLSGEAPVPESPDETAIALGEKSDLIADLAKLKSCPATQLRATAKKILTRYVWKTPREFTAGDLCEQVINALPANCHPSLAGQLRRFAAWLERQARAALGNAIAGRQVDSLDAALMTLDKALQDGQRAPLYAPTALDALPQDAPVAALETVSIAEAQARVVNAINDLTAHPKNGAGEYRRVVIRTPPGFGKTELAIQAIAGKQKTLWLAPTNALGEETEERFNALPKAATGNLAAYQPKNARAMRGRLAPDRTSGEKSVTLCRKPEALQALKEKGLARYTKQLLCKSGGDRANQCEYLSNGQCGYYRQMSDPAPVRIVAHNFLGLHQAQIISDFVDDGDLAVIDENPLGALSRQSKWADVEDRRKANPLSPWFLNLSLIHISEPTRPY